MTSSAMMAAAETLASVASAGPSTPAQEKASSKLHRRKSDASTSGSEPKKRTRPVSACEACRAKKVRCLLSPDAPVCQNCLASGKQCLFRVDDLAPALRAARFAHCGPPSANARTIASKKSSKAASRKSMDGIDEEDRPSPPKRKKSEDDRGSSDAIHKEEDADVDMSSNVYAAPKPISAPHVDETRPRRKTSDISARRQPGPPVDPMSLEYYGHPSDPASSNNMDASDRPLMDHRSSSHASEPPRRDMSTELRDGIERWQRSGAARPGDEREYIAIKEEPVAQPRPKIVLPFFRWFGTTANTPGYRKIKVGVLQDSEVPGTDELAPALEADNASDGRAAFGFTIRDDDDSRTPGKPRDDSVLSPHPAQLSSPGQRPDHKASSSVTRDLFEINRPRYPRKDILEHLVSLFLTHFKPSWCPWMEADELKNSAQNGSMPAILANAVCAVAARFSDRPELRKAPRKSSGDPFSEMAKILIIPLLSFPSIEVIEALILLSYAEFAAGSDSGLWMYVGMALRMAQDLGLQHEVSIQSIPIEKHQEKARLLFWAVIGLDRITTFGTGRPVSIRETEIDTELPKLGASSDMKDETVVFGHVVRILMLRGRMGELLNRREKEESQISAETTKRDLTRMWFELAQSYSELPSNLHFNVQTFQQSAAHHQSPGFVYLHVLFQSTIGLLDRPALMKKFTADSAPLLPSFAPAASAAASRTIADILTLGDAFDDRCITASPYLDQLVLPAGRSFVAEREAARGALRSMGHGTTPAPSRPPSRGAGSQQQSRTSHLVSTKSYAEINLGACQRILQKLQQYWAGASWPLRALEQEAAGNGGEIDPQASDEDAQSAPIRDIEMVLKWAKSRIRSKKRLARSSHVTPKADAMTLSESMEGINGILTGNTGSDEFASTHSGDSPFGLGISAGLTFDIDALMGSWQMDHFDPMSSFHAPMAVSQYNDGNQQQQVSGHTPYPASGQTPVPTFTGPPIYPSPGRRSSLSTHLHPSSAVVLSPHRGHSRNSSLHNPANPMSLTAYHPPTPGQLDTSSFAIAEFFSHDQSVWPLSIQNEDIDQEAVNLIASAMQLPSYSGP
uniref:Zn(2)-C6 fungal-type domain-containing protein n=1 Tax=Kalmanozyma brasiliensis (strain GHG001) TaxID=1365824 RepID=V5GRX5_KALBG